MRVTVQSILPCPASAAWEEVQKSSLLHYVSWPLVTYLPQRGEQIPERWEAGATVSIRSRLFGIVPIGTRILNFERILQSEYELQTREHDPLIRKWDHLIRVERKSENTSLYSDDVDIDAGLLTVPVFLFAYCFFRHRQRRWHKIAQRLNVA